MLYNKTEWFPKAHLFINNALYSASPYATPIRCIDYHGKEEVLANTDFKSKIIYFNSKNRSKIKHFVSVFSITVLSCLIFYYL